MIEKILVFIIGSCFGSFFNVCIYRLPKNISIIKPGSFCPKCLKPIKWFNNIPLLSYLILLGRCRDCKEKISFRYFLVEALTACLFLFLYMKFSLSLYFLKFAFFFCLLIVVSFIDIDYHAIPAYICFVGIMAGFVFAIYETVIVLKTGLPLNLPIVDAFKNMVFSLGFVYFFKFFGDMLLNVYLSIRKKDSIEGEKEALGLGDVDFMGVVGIFLGWKAVIVTFFLAPFIAVLYSVYALIFNRSHLIPYLPYLSLAAVISFFWANKILIYLGFM